MTWLVATAIALLVAVVVHYAHFRVQQRAWPTWTLVLGGTRAAFVQWLRVHTHAHLRVLEGTLRVARADYDDGQRLDALDVISSADALVARHVTWLRTWLQRWADAARLHAAFAPTPRPQPGPTELRPLRELAVVEGFVDAILPTRSARFHARIRFQRTALKWLAWHARAASRRARQPGEMGQALDQLDAACADLMAIDGRATITLEHLLLSLPHDALTHGGGATH